MKCTKETTHEFQPVNLSITFETKEELKIFKNFMGMDVTIPTELYNSHREGEGGVLSGMMGSIWSAL